MSNQPVSTPGDRKFTRTHEWIKIEGGIAVVGISYHAQHSLGDITFVELPAVGKAVKKEESCAIIESVKAASDIYAPLSGEITEVNKNVETHPESINSDPYGSAWLMKIKAADSAEADGLMDAASYDAFVKSEQ
jgi:glycine cleavage system H protein